MAQDHFKTAPDPKKGNGMTKHPQKHTNMLELAKLLPPPSHLVKDAWMNRMVKDTTGGQGNDRPRSEKCVSSSKRSKHFVMAVPISGCPTNQQIAKSVPEMSQG